MKWRKQTSYSSGASVITMPGFLSRWYCRKMAHNRYSEQSSMNRKISEAICYRPLRLAPKNINHTPFYLKMGLALISVLSVFLADTAVATARLVRANTGSRIRVARGLCLIIPPGALKHDTIIWANMMRRQRLIRFDFGPDGTTFSKPIELKLSWWAIRSIDSFIMNGEHGLKIAPRISWLTLTYELWHFSIYYFRRR